MTAPAELAFAQRRRRLLQFFGSAVLAVSLAFMLRFGLQGQADLVLMQLMYMAVAGGALLLLLNEQARAAAWLFVLACAGAVAVNGWWIDIPTPGAPRSVQLYLLPLALGAQFLLSREPPALRRAALVLLLLLFVLLAALPNPLQRVSPLPPEERALLVWLVPVISAALLAACLRLLFADQRDQAQAELELAQAIVGEQLELHYQPQCDGNGRPFAVQALLRWQHPVHGMVPPASFIPLAETSGLIHPLGELVLRQAAGFARRCLLQRDLGHLQVAVKISAAQLASPAQADRLLQLARDLALPAGVLKFELAESLFSAQQPAMRDWLQRCRAAGIATALDEFGTGFASLAQLSGLPFDQLKIDRRFVREGALQGRGGALVQTLLQLGRQLQLDVVAEGVETREALLALQQLGCRRFQGDWFARPMPADAALAWLARAAAP